MSFQRITSSGSERAMKRLETLSCRIRSPTCSSSRSSARCARESWKPSSSATASASFPADAPDDLRLLACLQADLLHAIADDPARRLVDVVADVVERACEPVHVIAVERRDERAIEEVDQLVGEPVALVLQLLHLAFQARRRRREPVEQLDEALGDRDDVPAAWL